LAYDSSATKRERQRRLLLGSEAAELGRDGVKAVADATDVHPDTVARGVREVEGPAQPQRRVRAPGGGRKKLSETDPELAAQLKALVDPETRGDPMSLLVWTTKSTKNLADALTELGHAVSDRTVARMLPAQGFSLQANTKVTEGRQHEDRDAQFRYLAGQSPGSPRTVSQWSPSMPRRRSWSGRSRTAAGSTSRPGSPSRSTCTTSRTRSSARRSRTASTTCRPTPAG